MKNFIEISELIKEWEEIPERKKALEEAREWHRITFYPGLSKEEFELRRIYPDLKKFGYAPGGYSGICRTCQQDMTWVDKRANTCIHCAIELFKKEPYQFDIFDM